MKHATWYRLRGSRAGRRPAPWVRPFTCAGCHRQHGPLVERVEYNGQLYCWRQYFRTKDAERAPRP